MESGLSKNILSFLRSSASYKFRICNSTFQLYSKGGQIKNVKTNRSKSVIGYTFSKDPRQDKFPFMSMYNRRLEKQRWKRVFQYTIEEIENEVRFRPGMCGMEDCMLSFEAHVKDLS